MKTESIQSRGGAHGNRVQDPQTSSRWLLALACTTLVLTACSKSSSPRSAPAAATVPNFTAATFTNPTQVDNPFFPLVVGVVNTYLAEEDDEFETIIVEVLETTRVVDGVECVVVRDRVFEEELLIEDTHDWFAQDDAGNVWYMGEEVDNYEYDDDGNVVSIDHEGAWEAGLDVAGLGTVAKPGHLMKAMPAVGDKYHQEFYAGAAEDTGEVVALSVPITLSDGRMFTCLKTRDASTLDTTSAEFKYYAPGIGPIVEEQIGGNGVVELKGTFTVVESAIPDFGAAFFTDPSDIDATFLSFVTDRAHTYIEEDEDESETIIIEALPDTRVIQGVECAVIRDRVFQDDLLVEDTHDWFAQDDAGNVWYMGEDVDNYEYDDDGNVTSIDHDGAWEAGTDPEGTGEVARPGYLIKASAAPGDTYYQEFYEEEAEDMAFVVATDATAELEDGTVYKGCLLQLEWNPLEPDTLEYKYYAPGLGLVLEEKLGFDGTLELKGTYDTSVSATPVFEDATFTDPDEVTHDALQFLIGNTFTYEADTEDGKETIVVEVLDLTRTVLGLECAVVRDRVFLEGLLIEDTHDWYAQDDDGNVWYMGEEVDNYNYDDEGMLVDIDNDGAWEAGLDVAGTGSFARPGYLITAASAPGMSYQQEHYPDEAEDRAVVVSLEAEVELSDGTVYKGCLQVLEWNPLEPGGLEHKFYAPGVGLVLEEELGGGDVVELVEITP